jgi:hypothetical protein
MAGIKEDPDTLAITPIGMGTNTRVHDANPDALSPVLGISRDAEQAVPPS